MIHRLEVETKGFDTRADVLRKRLQHSGFNIKEVRLVDVYTIDKNFTTPHLQKISSVLVNPVVQSFSFDKAIVFGRFVWAIEIGYLPGVTDNIATTTREMIEDLLHTRFGNGEGVYTSQLLYLTGKISGKEVRQIAASLYNPLIQRAQIKSFDEFTKFGGMDTEVPRVRLTYEIHVDEVNLNVSDDELSLIGKKGIANPDETRRGPLALDLLYMRTIRDHFHMLGRNPTGVELESIAQTWSEHCKHTIFANPIDEVKDGLFKTYIKGATDHILKQKTKKNFCVSVFTDNSGAIEFDTNWLVTHKAETHNSPSALDPFGGAITGIVGVNRDAIGFGLGAKPIVSTYGFCFADPNDKTPLYKGPDFTQQMLSPRRIMDGVIAGVNSGGNCSGIPTPQGFVFFDGRYKGKPLVFVGTVGLIPRRLNGKTLYKKKARPGDYIVMVGGRVGLDGIHGATFSSEALDTGSPATAVQIGDPITQKKLSDALIKEARDLGLYHSITDNGAGGLSCSVAEMAKECGGCTVELTQVPLKYPGLAPWQIWISESQERMTLAVAKTKWKQFAALMKKRGVEARVIGTFTSTPKCVVTYKGKTVMDVGMQFLHHGLPVRPMKSRAIKRVHIKVKLPSTPNIVQLYIAMLKRLNIASRDFISTQYDHEVQGNSVLKPLQGRGRISADAYVVRPLLGSMKGLVLSHGIYPTYSDIDTYHMAACSLDTAIRNAVAAGADPSRIALLDNFCWCSSQEPERLWQLKRAAQACYDYSVYYGTPFISGKDSMFNDFKGYDHKGQPIKISIPPTLLISSIGVIDDVTTAVSLDAKFAGDLIYILGQTHNELGASEYVSMIEVAQNNVPEVNAKKNKKLYDAFYTCVQQRLIASSQSIGPGGLAVALAKTAMGGMLGMNVALTHIPADNSRDDVILFSESQGRILVTVTGSNQQQFEKCMKGNAYARIGQISEDNTIQIAGKTGKSIVNLHLDNVAKAYRSTFKDY